jgi:hypothetical protein
MSSITSDRFPNISEEDRKYLEACLKEGSEVTDLLEEDVASMDTNAPTTEGSDGRRKKRSMSRDDIEQYVCDLQRSKGVKLIINDDYTHKYIIHVLNQFDQDIHSRQRQTDEQFTYSNCFHRSYSQQVREKESNSHESIQESA